MAALEFLDGAAVRRWCGLAAEALGAAREQIDALNVFPVADSDTGTNLHLTMLAGVQALDALPQSAGQEAVWNALTRGVLLGAQGNSGVIMSEYLRGLAEVCAPASPCGAAATRQALAHAARLSHAAVGEPVEGTVLTVASAGARAAAASAEGLAAVAIAAADGARKALARTTAQLDVLARAGVVDAGAAGLCLLFDTFAAVVTGTFTTWHALPFPAARAVPAGRQPLVPAGRQPPVPAGRPGGDPAGNPDSDLAGNQAGYEVMYLLEAPREPVARLRDRLGQLGDSLVVVGGADLWNVHVHVADPGAAIEAGIAAGRPYRIRVTYLGTPGHPRHGQTVHAPPIPEPPAPGQGGSAPAAIPASAGNLPGHRVVAVAAGDGLADLLAGAGAVVVRRAHDRLPSPAKLLSAVRQAGRPTSHVVIVPGDERVTSVAETVAAQALREGITAAVIPAQAAVQTLSALAMHDPMRAFDDDVAVMAETAAATRWGQVTWAASAGRPADAGTSDATAGTSDATAGTSDATAGTSDATAGTRDVDAPGQDAGAAAIAVVDRLLAVGGDLVTLVTGAPAGAPAPAEAEVAGALAPAEAEVAGALAPADAEVVGAFPPAGHELVARVAAHLRATRPDVEIITHDGGEAGYLLLIGVE